MQMSMCIGTERIGVYGRTYEFDEQVVLDYELIWHGGGCDIYG